MIPSSGTCMQRRQRTKVHTKPKRPALVAISCKPSSVVALVRAVAQVLGVGALLCAGRQGCGSGSGSAWGSSPGPVDHHVTWAPDWGAAGCPRGMALRHGTPRGEGGRGGALASRGRHGGAGAGSGKGKGKARPGFLKVLTKLTGISTALI